MKGYFSNDRNRSELTTAITRGLVVVVDLEKMTSYAKDRGAKEGKVLSSQAHKAKETCHTYCDAGKEKTTLAQYRGEGCFSESRHCMNLNPDYESQEFILFHSSEGSFKKILCSSKDMVDVIKAIANDEDPYPEFSGKTSGKKSGKKSYSVKARYELENPKKEVSGLKSLFDEFESYGNIGTTLKKGDICPKDLDVFGIKNDDSEKIGKNFNQFLTVTKVERKGRIISFEAKVDAKAVQRFDTGCDVIMAMSTLDSKKSVLETTLDELLGSRAKEIDKKIADLMKQLDELAKERNEIEEKAKKESRFVTAKQELDTANTTLETFKTEFAELSK